MSTSSVSSSGDSPTGTIVWRASRFHTDVPIRSPGLGQGRSSRSFTVGWIHAHRSGSPGLSAPAAIRLVIWFRDSEPEVQERASLEVQVREALATGERELRQRLSSELTRQSARPGTGSKPVVVSPDAISYLPPLWMRWLCTPIQTEWIAVDGARDSQGAVSAMARVVGFHPQNRSAELRVIVALSRKTSGACTCESVGRLVEQHVELMHALARRLRLQGESVITTNDPRFVVADAVETVRAEEGPGSYGAARGPAPMKTGEERNRDAANAAAAEARAMARRATTLAAHAGDLTRQMLAAQRSTGGEKRSGGGTATASRRRR